MEDNAANETIGREIERKFRVSSQPAATELGDPRSIEQGYLAVSDDGTEVRLRRSGERHTLTVKTGGGLERGEAEVELSREQFDALWPATSGRRVEKDRYRIPWRGATVELDVFRGVLQGLIVAEVEFASVESSGEFSSPPWFGDEVTGDARFLNRNLALGEVPRP